jgi:peptidoglycan/xylan/chitin deacetylase (PgdA/CDA1 family)
LERPEGDRRTEAFADEVAGECSELLHQKLIALTFDLCEEGGYVAGYDGRGVDLLRAQGIKATFFAGGKWMETHPERAAQLIANPLFEVGSHGLKHADLSRTNEAVTKDEITVPRGGLCPGEDRAGRAAVPRR